MANDVRRPKMPVSERAKQFMPFSPLSGLHQALEEKRRQRLRVPRMEFSEEMTAVLNVKLSRLVRGASAAITYYRDGEVLTYAGTVEKVDPIDHTLTVGGLTFSFDDLYDIFPIETESEVFQS